MKRRARLLLGLLLLAVGLGLGFWIGGVLGIVAMVLFVAASVAVWLSKEPAPA